MASTMLVLPNLRSIPTGDDKDGARRRVRPSFVAPSTEPGSVYG